MKNISVYMTFCLAVKDKIKFITNIFELWKHRGSYTLKGEQSKLLAYANFPNTLSNRITSLNGDIGDIPLKAQARVYLNCRAPS